MSGTFVVTSRMPLTLRAAPDRETGRRIASMPPGARVQRLEGAPGDVWFRVRWLRRWRSLTGWAASRWLRPVQASAADLELWELKGLLYQLVWGGAIQEAPLALRQAIEAMGPFLSEAAALGELSTPARTAHFFAQCAHESFNFTRLEEGLNYSRTGLEATFGRRLRAAGVDAADFARRPEAIANLVYANRLGNGPPESGDGWRFRGRGYIQLTGRDNYRARSRELGLGDRLERDPDLVAAPEWALKTAAAYWRAAGLNAIVDKHGGGEAAIRPVTRRVNGGYHGLEDRARLTRAALRIWDQPIETIEV